MFCSRQLIRPVVLCSPSPQGFYLSPGCWCLELASPSSRWGKPHLPGHPASHYDSCRTSRRSHANLKWKLAAGVLRKKMWMQRVSLFSRLRSYRVFPKLSSKAHFSLRTPGPPLVERAPPAAPAPPCLPGDAMAKSETWKDTHTHTHDTDCFPESKKARAAHITMHLHIMYAPVWR